MSAVSAAESKNLPNHVYMRGDTVQVRHDIENKPRMVVFEKVMGDAGQGRKKLDRVMCFWFDAHGVYHTQGFDGLDLIILARAQNAK